jgi:membrane-bound metal-dependent hydrolase YbcI (DUF457 family)
MAGFRTHITVSGITGFVYGGMAVQPLGFDTDVGVLAAGLTTAGGMLPDLDSDSGRPLREVFGLLGAVVPLLLVPRMAHAGMTREAILATWLFGYVCIRYVLAQVFRRLTVHRGMFHSLPALLIAGLLVYLAYDSADRGVRLLLAGGVMLGFLSHLILDELYSVDLRGLRVRLKSSAGSALKLRSSSTAATATCYALLGGLLYLTYLDVQRPAKPDDDMTLPLPPQRRVGHDGFPRRRMWRQAGGPRGDDRGDRPHPAGAISSWSCRRPSSPSTPASCRRPSSPSTPASCRPVCWTAAGPGRAA